MAGHPADVGSAEEDIAVVVVEDVLTAVDSLGDDGVDAALLVISGNAHSEIVRVVNEQGVDLVILSTHGRRGVSRALLGSVADEVVHDVGVPVMIVRRS